MSLEKTFRICDPLYNYIYLDRDELALFNHSAFQRLRLIRQLGFSDIAFPSAVHTRFTHSLGVSHLAGEAFDSIFEKNKGLLSDKKKQLFKKTLRIASLLHDIGHGPFSHSSECLMPPLKKLNLSAYLKDEERQARHEDYSLKFILEEEKLLKQMGLEPSSIAQILHPDFIGDTSFFKEKGLNFLPLLRQILSSPFDVDRMDYLYRDSLFCGVKYGLIDFIWLIAQMSCHIPKNQINGCQDQVFLSIDNSARYTLESLMLGRQHMRLVVYFHHKSAIYNEILKKYSKTCNWFFPAKLSEYLEFTDSKLLERLKTDDNVWAKSITEKKPYLRLYEVLDCMHSDLKKSTPEDAVFYSLQEQLTKAGINFIAVDSQKNSIKPSKKEKEKSPVFLENKSLSPVQKWDQDPNLFFIPARTLKRIYVPPKELSSAQKLLKSLL